MLGRLAQLCLRQSEVQPGLQLLRCVAAASTTAPSSITLWPQQQHHHRHQQHNYSSSSNAAPAPVQQQERQQQQQHAPLPDATEVQEGAGPAPRSSRLAAARPTQPSMQILKVLLESEQPLTSHELQARVQQQYTHFPTRNSFKAYLKHLLRQKWVVAKAPAAKVSSTRSGHKKSQKGSDGHWLFSPTLVSWKLDLNSPGRPLQALALQEADVWTRQQLPAYADHMRQGRVPVTWQNLGVLTNAKQREEQYRKQLLAEGGQGAQQRRLGAGDEAAGSLQQLKQKKKQRR